MPGPETFELAGHRWQVRPIGVEAQIEVELILVRLLGPGLAGAASAAIHAVAGPLVEVIREQAKHADIAGLSELELKSPEVKAAWGDMLVALQEAGIMALDAVVMAVGDALREGVPAITDRASADDIKRLFALCILDKRTMVEVGGKWRDVTDYGALSKVLAGSPGSKYQLLRRAIMVTYSPEPVAIEDA